MKKQVLFFLLASAVCANSFGYEIYKGKLLNHKEWSAGNLNVTFKRADGFAAQKIKDFKNSKGPQGSNAIQLLATSLNGSAVVGQPISLKGGTNIVFIQNNSDVEQKYDYLFGVCVTLDQHRDQCSYWQDTVSLEPEGYINDGEEPSILVRFDNPGSYGSITLTRVTTFDYSTFLQSFAGGSISVSGNDKKG